MKNEHEIRIALGRALNSQGIGSKFSKTLEKRILNLKKQLSKI